MISDTEALFARLDKLINDANEKQTTALKLEIQAEVSGVKSEIAELKEIIEQERDKINKLEKTQTDLQFKYKILKKSLKRNNILIFGLNYENKQNALAEYIIDKINQYLELHLTIDCLNNVYPVGKSETTRPILVQFQSYLTKRQVLKECRKLKRTEISISEDLTKEDREQQKNLIKHKKLAQSKGHKAYVKNNKLYVNNEEYTVQDLQQKYNEEQPETSQKQESLRQRKISSAPATPTVQYVEETDEEIDEENIDDTTEVNSEKKRIATELCGEKAGKRTEEDSDIKKPKTVTVYTEGHKEKKHPIRQKPSIETKRINTRSVNK